MIGILAAFLATAGLSAATITVGPGGAPDYDYATIQAAINAADPGNTIQVAAGTYTERLMVTKAITLQGAGAGLSIIDGTGLTGPALVSRNTNYFVY